MSILIVEDDAVSRKLIVSILEMHNFTVEATASAHEALEFLQSGEPCELIITDIMMPVMDGFALVRKVKADKRLCRIPIILCTSLNDRDSIVKGIQLGVTDYIAKPVKGAILISKITEVLERHSGVVLVVDDEELIRNLLTRTLQREGFTVLAAESGPQALEIMDKTKVRLIVSDIVMPEMDGFELLGNIKEIDPNIPVILVSGRGGQTRDKVLAAGADDFIAKPFHNTEIVKRVSALYK